MLGGIMARVYRTTDKISVKIDDITVKISPLSYEQKSVIQSLLISGDPLSVVKAAKESIRYAVKEVSGVEDSDGSVYELMFDEGVLSDSCIDDLLNIDPEDKLSLVCTSLLNGIPKGFVDPQTGKPIDGITIERPKSGKKA